VIDFWIEEAEALQPNSPSSILRSSIRTEARAACAKDLSAISSPERGQTDYTPIVGCYPVTPLLTVTLPMDEEGLNPSAAPPISSSVSLCLVGLIMRTDAEFRPLNRARRLVDQIAYIRG
jgi:hypothetical protein